MEVIEDGNIMDRIPILLQRDLEYYQINQTVLSEKICCGVVGGRLDFPRSASFAAVKIVLWLEEEFSIAFKQGSGMFVKTDEDSSDGGVAKTSDPDKFVQLAVKSSDSLLEHLHMLAQEALDHADLPVLTATLGAAALLKNSLYCYLQHVEDTGNSERQSIIQSCYKRYVTMSEAVAERVLDLHNRVLSLYIMQDSGGRPIDTMGKCVVETGTPSVQGWWLYMNGSRKDLWDTVPPRMAQRIFAGMLNETLTILSVRYCQTNTSDSTTPLLINDILNILLCVSKLLPFICASGTELCGAGDQRGRARDVRDVHAKCNQLFNCMVYRGAELHFLHQAFKEKDDLQNSKDCPYPWFRFVSPNLFDTFDDVTARSTTDFPNKTAIGLELIVLLAQPQPSWASLVKVLMMRDCQLMKMLLIEALRKMSADNSRWPADGLWYGGGGSSHKCDGFLCTADGFCQFKGDDSVGEEYARAAGALTYVVCSVGSAADVRSSLCYALEISGRDWAACLDKRQVWCDKRPAWLAALLSMVGTALRFIPPILVNAIQTGASMYQTMSLCLTCISRSLECVPRCLVTVTSSLQTALPCGVRAVGGSIFLQMLITRLYDEMIRYAAIESTKETTVLNGAAHDMNVHHRPRSKQVRIVSLNTTTSSSVSFDGSHSTSSSIALAIAEALCSIDEDDKHTTEIEQLVADTRKTCTLTSNFGLEDYPEFADFFEEGTVPASNAERTSDAAALTSQILMTSTGRDSLRVIYDHVQLHSERIYQELSIQESSDDNVSLSRAPLLYTMFHIGKRPFDQYFRGEWPMPWSRLVSVAKRWSGIEGAKVHINIRTDIRNIRNTGSNKSNKQLMELYNMCKSQPEGLL
ncbi:uncharacterized protein LOC126967120 isoform X2 [Leptidea sinapis]|uniref:uncharacterized protein LOC126967120 isoform X2 n=1 Tax=Leptidea sinapis TaxID=189913 RepID=UPI0021297695|nr:uncharacterized protein LOC126967120 isoform X2 [Leptidea sinapis]